MFNLFKQPFEEQTLEDWAKLSVDLAKVAMVAVPVVIYGDATISMKLLNSILLVTFAYIGLYSAREFRKKQGE